MNESKKPTAREQGYDAYLVGKSDTDNPFDQQSDEYLDWNDGYAEAESDEAM